MRPLKMSHPAWKETPAVFKAALDPEFSAPTHLQAFFEALSKHQGFELGLSNDPEFFQSYPEWLPLKNLAQESDAELFWYDFYRFGTELGNRGFLDLWYFTMEWLRQQNLPPALHERLIQKFHSSNWERTLPQLLSESLDPKILMAMGIGRLAFHQSRLTSIERLVHWGAPQPLRGAIGLGSGILAETVTFHSTWQFLESLFPGSSSHSIPWEESLLSSAFILGFVRAGEGLGNLLLPRRSGRFITLGRIAFPVGILSIGLGLEPWFRGEAMPRLHETFETVIITFLQWYLSESLLHYFSGPDLFRLEHRAQAMAVHWEIVPSLQPAMGHAPKSYWMEGSPQSLGLDYRKNFPPEGPHTFSQEIITAWENTPLPTEAFRERLLEAYARAPNRGSRDQLHTAIAIQKLFRFDALNSSHGSLENALLQLGLGQSLAISSGVKRNHILQDFFRQMESGWNREKFLELTSLYPLGSGFAGGIRPKYSESFYRKHFAQVSRDWRHLSNRERRLLWNQVYLETGGRSRPTRRMIKQWGQWTHPKTFGSVLAREVLEVAYLHRQGRLLLRRLEYILKWGDHPAKIRELMDLSDAHGTVQFIEEFVPHLSSADRHSAKLVLSSHDAFMGDPRLARKLLSVIPEVTPYLYKPSDRLDQVRQFRETVHGHYTGEMSPDFLLEILTRHPNSQSKQLIDAVHEGLVKIKVIPENQFIQMKQNWSQEAQVEVGFYRPQNILGRPDELILRQMPALALDTHKGREQAVFQVGIRVKALLHEFEHWRHFRGYFSGIERGLEPFAMTKPTRHDRLTSEMIAVLEEQRWTNQYFGVDLWRTANRLSPHWMTFLRDSHGVAYPPPGQKKK